MNPLIHNIYYELKAKNPLTLRKKFTIGYIDVRLYVFKRRNSMEILRILNLLGDRTRLKILQLLRKGEKSVSKIVQSLKLTQPTVSHHLKKLEEAGLVIKRRYKKWVIYSANVDSLKIFIKKLGLELDL